MEKHSDCANECQQAVDYGVWAERSCSPECVWLKRERNRATFDAKVRTHGYVDRVTGERIHDPEQLTHGVDLPDGAKR